MKCLSLKQPFADLLSIREKTVELRKWNTKFKCKFLIHASKNMDIDACKRLDIDIDKLTKGAILVLLFYMMLKSIKIKKSLTRINKNIFLLLVHILMDTNTVS